MKKIIAICLSLFGFTAAHAATCGWTPLMDKTMWCDFDEAIKIAKTYNKG
jgi:hypothetical protein